MKDFYTNILKASANSILLSILLLGFATPASADEYKSMIRYDRVWECFSTHDGREYYTFKCMRFDGEEEIGGKTYHRIVTFKKRKRTHDSDGNAYNTVVDCMEHEGYLREEGSKVYTLVREPEEELYGDGWGIPLGWPYIPEVIFPENHDGYSEHLLYDMSWQEGECYDCMSFVEGMAFDNRLDVINVSQVDIEGEEHKIMYVGLEGALESYKTYNYPLTMYQPIVEGIGAVDYGCLNYHELIGRPNRLYTHNYFTRLLDMEGNVIYPENPDDNYDYGSFSSVMEMPTDASADTDAPIYDMMGRRISAPASGQLYIQNGKKHIAR